MKTSTQQALSSSPATFIPVRAGLLQRKCGCGNHVPGGGQCAACAEKKRNPQRSASEHEQSASAPANVQEVTGAAGHPLEARVRDFMEHGFGHDFSQVRVHTGTRAAASARAVDAHAYTVGNHVVFGAGKYAAGTPSGAHLLAHELTHVVQQRAGGNGVQYDRAISHPSDPAEIEADAVAERVVAGDTVRVAQPAGAVLQPLSLGGAIGLGAGAVAAGVGIAALLGAFSGKKKQNPKCPGTHNIPDDTYAAIGTAWGKSKHGTATVTEHGGRIVTDKTGGRVIRAGSGGGGSISLPGEKAGDSTLGTFHTHPYSIAEGSELGVPFSGGDIANFIAGGQGTVKYIGAGSCNFALDTQDATARDACKKVDVTQRFDNAFAGASGSLAAQSETGVLAAIEGCGLCFYKACRLDEKSPIPKSAKLV